MVSQVDRRHVGQQQNITGKALQYVVKVLTQYHIFCVRVCESCQNKPLKHKI